MVFQRVAGFQTGWGGGGGGGYISKGWSEFSKNTSFEVGTCHKN